MNIRETNLSDYRIPLPSWVIVHGDTRILQVKELVKQTLTNTTISFDPSDASLHGSLTSAPQSTSENALQSIRITSTTNQIYSSLLTLPASSATISYTLNSQSDHSHIFLQPTGNTKQHLLYQYFTNIYYRHQERKEQQHYSKIASLLHIQDKQLFHSPSATISTTASPPTSTPTPLRPILAFTIRLAHLHLLIPSAAPLLYTIPHPASYLAGGDVAIGSYHQQLENDHEQQEYIDHLLAALEQILQYLLHGLTAPNSSSSSDQLLVLIHLPDLLDYIVPTIQAQPQQQQQSTAQQHWQALQQMMQRLQAANDSSSQQQVLISFTYANSLSSLLQMMDPRQQQQQQQQKQQKQKGEGNNSKAGLLPKVIRESFDLVHVGCDQLLQDADNDAEKDLTKDNKRSSSAAQDSHQAAADTANKEQKQKNDDDDNSEQVNDKHYIPGLTTCLQAFERHQRWPQRLSSLYQHLGLSSSSRQASHNSGNSSSSSSSGHFLLYGASNTGKTYLAHQVAHSFARYTDQQRPYSRLMPHYSDIISSQIGGSERNLQKWFMQAQQSTPCLLIWDEADVLFSTSSACDDKDSSSSSSSSLLSTFIQCLESIQVWNNYINSSSASSSSSSYSSRQLVIVIVIVRDLRSVPSSLRRMDRLGLEVNMNEEMKVWWETVRQWEVAEEGDMIARLVSRLYREKFGREKPKEEEDSKLIEEVLKQVVKKVKDRIANGDEKRLMIGDILLMIKQTYRKLLHSSSS